MAGSAFGAQLFAVGMPCFERRVLRMLMSDSRVKARGFSHQALAGSATRPQLWDGYLQGLLPHPIEDKSLSRLPVLKRDRG